MIPRYEITLTKTYHFRDDNNYPATSDEEMTYSSETPEVLWTHVARWLIENEPHPEDADDSSYNWTTIKVGKVTKVVEAFEADMVAVRANPAYVAFKAARQAEIEAEAIEEAARAERARVYQEGEEKKKLAELIAKHGIPDAGAA